jgi:tartrate dehydratase beta subunit/fumarate hydratase class I family protein
MADILAELTKHPVKTRLSLTGPLVVARDIAHAKIKERLDAGEPMPDYLRNHPVYYAGPAKTPEGMPSGRSGRRPQAGWTPTSTSSRPPAARWSCLPRATAASR